MNISKRIENLEKQIKPASDNVIWDFSNTTSEQLLTLERLVKSEKEEAERYTEQLINGGFLSYREGK